MKRKLHNGLTYHQLLYLAAVRHLTSNGGGTTVTDISKFLGIFRGVASNYIYSQGDNNRTDGFIKRGYITKADNRHNTIRLTENGKDVISKLALIIENGKPLYVGVKGYDYEREL